MNRPGPGGIDGGDGGGERLLLLLFFFLVLFQHLLTYLINLDLERFLPDCSPLPFSNIKFFNALTIGFSASKVEEL